MRKLQVATSLLGRLFSRLLLRIAFNVVGLKMAADELKTAANLKKKVSEVHAIDPSGQVFKVRFPSVVFSAIDSPKHSVDFIWGAE